MEDNIIWWHRINSNDFATKLFDYYLHVVRIGDGWFVKYGDDLVDAFNSMDVAFYSAEQFYKNEMIRRTDEPCL